MKIVSNLFGLLQGDMEFPTAGLSELDKRIKVYFNVLPYGHLPTASTCFSHLHFATSS